MANASLARRVQELRKMIERRRARPATRGYHRSPVEVDAILDELGDRVFQEAASLWLAGEQDHPETVTLTWVQAQTLDPGTLRPPTT